MVPEAVQAPAPLENLVAALRKESDKKANKKLTKDVKMEGKKRNQTSWRGRTHSAASGTCFAAAGTVSSPQPPAAQWSSYAPCSATLRRPQEALQPREPHRAAPQ
jgi:hypothetical protein